MTRLAIMFMLFAVAFCAGCSVLEMYNENYVGSLYNAFLSLVNAYLVVGQIEQLGDK